MTEADRQAFDAWLAVAPRHRLAYDEVAALWRELAPLDPALSPPQAGWHSPRSANDNRTRHRVLGSLIAACLALFMVGAAWDLPLRLRADRITAAGEQAEVTLSDGTVAFLNTDTAIAVDFSGPDRRVTLLKGEAFFQVAKNPARPFDVEAVGGRARAVGTAYAVRDMDDSARVTVTEGTVRVTSPMRDGAHGEVILTPGERVSYRRGGAPGTVQRIHGGETSALAWRRGVIVLDGAPLDQAFAEIDRYLPGRILLLADAAKLQPVTARLAITSLDGGIRALAATHGLKVTQVTRYLMIIR
ncbi:FecR domain-containing protein [Thalassospiraceae bacterium LMO-SO8]|nr:FecR domain-containing protein [Alphaproteobacteria bacterium LMO-S08]WND74768.1 FecR domain-containing protein [Thalassospiraceae bacterium LMO-SO8]